MHGQPTIKIRGLCLFAKKHFNNSYFLYTRNCIA